MSAIHEPACTHSHPTVGPSSAGEPPPILEQNLRQLPGSGKTGRSWCMWDASYQPTPGPPSDRLWDDEDVAAYIGFRSIDELIARHPRFPRPVPLGMQGRRWRPGDVVAWIDELCGAPGTPSGPIAGSPGAGGSIAASKVPAFDISILTAELQKGTHA